MSRLTDFIPDSDVLLAQGVQHLQDGRLAYGKAMVLRAHKAQPSLDSYLALAAIAQSESDKVEAIKLLRQALASYPASAKLRIELAEVLRDGSLQESLHHLTISFSLQPESPMRAALSDIYGAMGEAKIAAALRATVNQLSAAQTENSPEALSAIAAGDDAGAAAAFESFIRAHPKSIAARTDYGSTLLRLGRLEEAIAAQRECIRLCPWFAAAHHNLGAALQARGGNNEAVSAYLRAVSFGLNGVVTWLNLGRAYRAIGAQARAFDAYLMASRDNKPIGEIYAEWADVCRSLGHLKMAIECMDRLASIWPQNFLVFNNKGTYLLEAGDAQAAILCYQKALALNPNSDLAFANLASAYELLGRYEDALAAYDAAARIKPPSSDRLARRLHAAQHICMWADFESQSDRLKEKIRKGDVYAQPFSLLAIPSIGPEEQLLVARAYAPAAESLLRPDVAVGQKQRMKIAYVSSDLYEHATAWLLAETIELHDRERFEVNLYSYGAAPEDSMRQRLRSGADQFVDLHGLSDDEAARKLIADEVDIAVDLKGFTRGCRPGIFARRVAPLQINYLGFPGTLGAAYYDYIVADDVIIPERLERYYSEKIIRLPQCYQPNDRRRPLPAATPRAQLGLPERGIVFCSFNNVYKITPDIFRVWIRILRETSGSVLWILSSNSVANQQLMGEAVAEGLSTDRLVFAPRMSLADHFARFQAADIFLDTFPCSAHTTASDALWCGVPVVTMAGETFASRVASSLLAAVGHQDLVAQDLASYCEVALSLARDQAKLQDIKQSLANKRSTAALFDSVGYTRDFEERLAAVWAAHLRYGLDQKR